MSIFLTRREVLAMIAAAPAALAAQGPSQLPLRTSGLEHVGFTVPEPQKSAAFYGRIFDPQIFQEMSPPLRYYCRLGIGYVAFGGNSTVSGADRSLLRDRRGLPPGRDARGTRRPRASS